MPTTDAGAAPDGAGLDRCPVGLVPMAWPDPGPDLGGQLAAIAGLGFAGIQFGDPGPDPGPVRTAFQAADLAVAERYFPIRCTADGPAAGSAREGDEHLRQLLELDGDVLVAAIDGSPDRDRMAGRADPRPRLTSAGWTALVDLLHDLARRATDAGVEVSFHPHAGTFVETPEETAELMERTDAGLVHLCLDTGHWIVGGGDPVEAVRRYDDRLSHLHVKDVDAAVLAALRDGALATLTEAVDEVVFCPLGTGVLALDDLLLAVTEAGYRGWLMIEQDSFVGDAPSVAAANRAALAAAVRRTSSSGHR
jgi:inosose dehydratase